MMDLDRMEFYANFANYRVRFNGNPISESEHPVLDRILVFWNLAEIYTLAKTGNLHGIEI